MTESTKRTVELHIPSELGYEKVAMAAAASLAQEMGFSPDRVEDLKTALAEACINAIEHGNRGDARKDVLVLLTAGDSQLEIDVRDQGTQALPADAPAPRIKERLVCGIPSRGWGLFLIKSLVDEVAFNHLPQGGHAMRMVIRIQGANGSDILQPQ